MNYDKNNNNDTISLTPSCLWLVALTYSMLSLLSNWFVIFTISLDGLILNAGLLIYLISFLTSNFITEIYGYQHTRRIAWCGFLFNLVFILYGQAIIYLPSPSYSTHNPLFDLLIATYLKSVLISVVSYFMLEPYNLFLMAKLKIIMNGHYLKLRFALVTSLSFMLSWILFFNLVRYSSSLIPSQLLPTIIITSILIMTGSTLAIYLTKKIKLLEQLDIYDKNTRFNMFKFTVNYTMNDNEFGKHNL